MPLKTGKIHEHFKFIFKVYLLGILVFTIFRFFFLINEYSGFSNVENEKFSLILMSFLTGLRFDIVISGYLTAIPLLGLTIASFFKKGIKLSLKIFTVLMLVFYIISFGVCAADIPYFHHFFQRLSVVAFAWKDTPDIVTGMVLGEFSYWGFVIPFIILSFVFSILINKYRRQAVAEQAKQVHNIKYFISNISCFIIIFGLIFLGIRGRANKMPISVKTAYFSNHPLANQIGLNPNFTLIRSLLDETKVSNAEIKLIDENFALKYTKEQFEIQNNIYDSPIARYIQPDDTIKKMNVIIVVMEAMSAEKTGILGKTDLTPHLDSIAGNGILFSNIYSAGTHTYNGLYATLFSYPSLKRKHPFNNVNIQKYSGLTTNLKKNGYQTVYFTTHKGHFDNVEGFFIENGFETIVSQKDYPSKEVVSVWGVSDHYLFEHSIPVLNELHKNKKPFLSVYMTVSDHGPYIIPDNISFKKKYTDIKKDIVRYADWSIGRFMKSAAKQEWFENTLFVFVADHGEAMNNAAYDMPISSHHIPLIFYSPAHIDTSYISDKLGGQIDIFPTTAGFLNLPYVNNTFGLDLFSESRDFVYFVADNNIACINNEYYLIIQDNGIETLHKYKTNDRNNYINEYSHITSEMKEYTFSMMQTAQYILKNNLQADIKP